MPLIPFVLDFTEMGMNTTLATDKASFVEVKNVDPSRPGSFRKKKGLEDYTSGSDIAEAKVNALASLYRKGDKSATLAVQVAIADDEVSVCTSVVLAWGKFGATVTNGDTYPYRTAWGITAAGNPAVYFANKGPGVVRVDTSATNTIIGSGTFTLGNSVEYFLDKLFVGGASGTPDSLYYSVTGDDDDWTGSGSGVLPLRYPGGGTNAGSLEITGLRVYRDRLYILSEGALHVLTGTTSATFGTTILRDQNFGNGSTMWVAGEMLYWVDRDGIWQFNGTVAQNIGQRDMRGRWETLSDQNDIDLATGSWDNQYRYYTVYFPAVKEQWYYFYDSNEWYVKTYTADDAIRVIGPPATYAGLNPNAVLVGAATNGKVYVEREATTDDGNAITASFKTGEIRLGEIQGGKPGDRFTIQRVDIETAEQNETGVVNLIFTVDGVAQTSKALTVTDAGASAETFPTSYDGVDSNTQIDISDILLTGKYMQLEVTDDDANSRCDIRRIIIWYERLEGLAG
jgi:hypothetical protein